VHFNIWPTDLQHHVCLQKYTVAPAEPFNYTRAHSTVNNSVSQVK